MSEDTSNNPQWAEGAATGSGQRASSAALDVTQDLLSGPHTRPRYLSILPLSSGGMANLELAVGFEAGNFKKLVVQKTIREELAFDPELVAMFLSEARICARLNHSNLVQVYEVMEIPRPCIVMEYLEGLSMFDIQRKLGSSFDTNLQLRILSDVLAGLHYAHELCDYDGTPLGIVHRDVSPGNVIVTSEGRVKVLDFGIAKANNAPSYTQAGMVKGKMSYMSPEQLAGEPLDRRSDVYAVGCMLWRAASGKKLWAKMSAQEIMRCLVMGRIPPPSVHGEVDPKLEAIVVRATAANRKERYESADQLRHAVDDYLAEVEPGCELRDWMQDNFKEHWAERRKVIDESFSGATSVPPVGLERQSRVPISVAPESKSTKLITIGVVAAAVAVLLFGAVGLVERLDSRPAAQANAQVGAPDGKRELLIRLHAEPPAAQISVDKTPLVGNPAELRVAAGSEHLVEVALKGYLTVTRKLHFDRETTIEFALIAAPPSVPASATNKMPSSTRSHVPKPGRTSRLAPTDSAGASESEDLCQTPFYYKDGIKVYKPECL